jgi:hypothetical protein
MVAEQVEGLWVIRTQLKHWIAARMSHESVRNSGKCGRAGEMEAGGEEPFPDLRTYTNHDHHQFGGPDFDTSAL